MYGLCAETPKGLVHAICYNLTDQNVSENLLWRVIGAGPVDVTDDEQKPAAGKGLMEFMSEKSRAQPSAAAARAARKEEQDKEKEVKKKKQEMLAEQKREEREAAERDRDLEKERARNERERAQLENDKKAPGKKSGKRRGGADDEEEGEEEEVKAQLQFSKKEASASGLNRKTWDAQRSSARVHYHAGVRCLWIRAYVSLLAALEAQARRR